MRDCMLFVGVLFVDILFRGYAILHLFGDIRHAQ